VNGHAAAGDGSGARSEQVRASGDGAERCRIALLRTFLCIQERTLF
jgi:hypothetical protein